MNYFEHHIGDYAEATAHLSILEDGCYSRLIRKYYATERALPVEVDRVQRLVGARTDEERAAVEAVLQEFFDLRDDGWHQDRCDAAIAVYQAGAPEREVKKTNETARQHRHRAERANLYQALHDAGQFPAWNTPITEVRALVAKINREPVTAPVTPVTAPVTACNAPVTPPVTEPVTACNAPATATHSPVPSTQYPLPNPQPHVVVAEANKRKSKLPDGFAPNEAGVAAASGLLMEAEIDAFKNYHAAHGSLMLDWQAAWRTWCGKARKFTPRGAPPTKTVSKHAGFDKLDYREGINHDGTFAQPAKGPHLGRPDGAARGSHGKL